MDIIRASLIIGILNASCGNNENDLASTASVNDLSGKTFESECIEFFTIGLKITLIFKDTTDKVVLGLYQTPTCTGLYETQTGESNYTLGTTVSGLEKTFNYDSELTSNHLSLLTDQGVADANKESRYGYSDWVKGNEKNIAGKKESSESDDIESAIGSKHFDIIKIESDKITLGDINVEGQSGVTEAERPKALGISLKAK